MLLYGKTLAQEIKQQLITQRQQVFGNQKVYVAELFFGENPSIQVYVNLKVKYAEAIGMECKVFGQEKERNYEEVLLLIKKLNADPQCVGIICQQPLPAHLEPYKEEMCLAVHPLKDIDGLGGIINGRNQIWILSFQPATAKAVFDLRDYYQLGSMKGLNISIIGKSNVVGKPVAIECLIRGAKVQVFTSEDRPETIANHTKSSDVIISTTGAIHLVDKHFINPNGEQIIIDVGYGFLNGKATGDVKFEEVEPLVKHITPVPGGIWPLTVASLFANIFVLQSQKKLIETIWENVWGT